MTKYKVGMIGTGIKGTQHARAYILNPRTEIVAVADPDPENLELFCRRFKIARGYSRYDEMFTREQIDIAAPILPARPNPDAVVAAARAGVKAIYCEKPICASLAEADRMVEETRSRGIPWAAADAMRNLPQFWEARAKIESGEWGSVQSINIYMPTAADTRGEIWGANCQDLCVASLFAGDAEVDWVVGWVKEDPFSDEDQAMGGHIRFASGIECFAHIRPTCRRGIEILTSRVLFFSDYHSFHLWKLKGEAGIAAMGRLGENRGSFCRLRPQRHALRRGGLAVPGESADRQHSGPSRLSGEGGGTSMQWRRHGPSSGDFHCPAGFAPAGPRTRKAAP